MQNLVTISGTKIRTLNGLFSLNDLHRASGGENKHKPSLWTNNKQTIELAEEISKAGIPAIQSKQRLGTFVCKELVIHYGMWINPMFALQVIRTFLNVRENQNTINPEQQYQIKEAVMQLARKTGKRHPAIYHDLYNHFKIPRYQDLLAKDFQAALKFLQWSEPKQITHDENVILIPFGLLRNATYQVWVRDGKAQKRSVMYAEDARDIGKPWGSGE